MKIVIALAVIGALVGTPALADILVTPGTGGTAVTVFDFTCFSTKHCPTATLTSSAGAEEGNSGNPLIVGNNGTFAVQATLNAETTKVIGTVNQGTSPWVVSGNLTNISGTISLPTGAGTAANQTTINTSLGTINTTLGTINTSIQQGVGTSGATVPSNIIYLGCNGVNAEQAAVANGQLIGASCGLEGKLINLPYAVKEKMVRGSATSTSNTAVTLIAAAGSGIKNYIPSIQCSNSSVSADVITFNDVGGVGSGTVIQIPAGVTVTPIFPVPLVTAANTAFTFTPGSSVSTIYCNAQGYTGT